MHKKNLNRPLNVCAYCRISSDKEELETSLSEQIHFYSNLILDNPNWKFAGIFADDGISGTSIAQRKQFITMLTKARAGDIDIIITKSISRFARNVINLLETIQELRRLNVEVIFEREHFSSFDPKTEMMLTIYAKFAEEEAESISKNVKWRHEINVQNGNYFIPSNLYGFTKDKFGNIIINDSEAKWIKDIYQMYISLIPIRKIIDYLEKNNVKTPTGKKHWNSSTIRSMLQNEKYVGDCLMQKEFVADIVSHKRIKNRGEKPQSLIKNGHPAIIDRNIWNKVQELISTRRIQFKIQERAPNHGVRTHWTHFLICPYCYKYYCMKTSHSTKRKILMDSSNRETTLCRKSQSVYVDVLERVIIEQIKILNSNLPLFKESIIKSIENNEQLQLLIQESEKSGAELKILKERINSLDCSLEANVALFNALNSQIKELATNIAMLETKILIEKSSINTDSIIKSIKDANNITDINNIDFRNIFSKVVVINRDKLIFVIGDINMEKINENTKTIFNGTINHQERATIFTTEFGIVIGK